MTDQLGHRAVLGVLAPSTNTVVEPDYYRMAPDGVTAHVARIHIRDQSLDSNENFEALLVQVREEIDAALARVLTCEPDGVVMGMSAETFWGGIEGSRDFQTRMESAADRPVFAGASASDQALRLYGARKIAVVTPYQPIADENVRRFFTESGYDVVSLTGLRCPDAVSIARYPTADLRRTLDDINSPDVDAIVQVGTNLSMVRLADEAERWLAKPVIAINAATWWSALRGMGIDDKVEGAGDLLRHH